MLCMNLTSHFVMSCNFLQLGKKRNDIKVQEWPLLSASKCLIPAGKPQCRSHGPRRLTTKWAQYL